jgi:LacI family transcriptional regulator
LAKKKPTIDDVAAYSGVARTTVSRVLNGGPNVRPEVRERVQRAVDALDYKINMQARFLAGGASRQLTLVHASALDAEPNSYYHSGLELGALRGCSDRGFMLSTFALDANASNHVDRIVELVESRRSDGVVLTPPFSDDVALVRAVMRLNCPVVCVAGGAEVRKLTAAVGIDDAAAGYAMGRLIADLGHRRIGYIDGPESHMSAAQRLEGLKRALSEAHVASDQLRVERGDFTFRSGIERAEALLSRASMTALVCANDDMAAGAMLTLHRKGLDIPGDISVCGFDDAPVSEVIWPQLTTAHQPIRRLGQRAVEMLIEAIQSGTGAAEAAFETVPFRIVERASTGRARQN